MVGIIVDYKKKKGIQKGIGPNHRDLVKLGREVNRMKQLGEGKRVFSEFNKDANSILGRGKDRGMQEAAKKITREVAERYNAERGR